MRTSIITFLSLGVHWSLFVMIDLRTLSYNTYTYRPWNNMVISKY